MSETTSEDEVDSVYLTPAQEMGESIKEWLESPNSPDWQLADWLRANGRSRFLLTAPPLRLPGAVGSPATPVATV